MIERSPGYGRRASSRELLVVVSFLENLTGGRIIIEVSFFRVMGGFDRETDKTIKNVSTFIVFINICNKVNSFFFFNVDY